MCKVYFLAEEQVLDVVSELKSEVDKQRHKSRTLEREIKQKNVDIEAVRQYSPFNVHHNCMCFNGISMYT